MGSPPTWIGDWRIVRQKNSVGVNRLCHSPLHPVLQIPALSIVPHQQGKFDVTQRTTKGRMSGQRAFGSGWIVTAFWIGARIIETHPHNGDAVFVIERIVVQVQLVAQPPPAGVIPMKVCFMNLCLSRLTEDHDLNRCFAIDGGSRSRRQMRDTSLTTTNLTQEL